MCVSPFSLLCWQGLSLPAILSAILSKVGSPCHSVKCWLFCQRLALLAILSNVRSRCLSLCHFVKGPTLPFCQGLAPPAFLSAVLSWVGSPCRSVCGSMPDYTPLHAMPLHATPVSNKPQGPVGFFLLIFFLRQLHCLQGFRGRPVSTSTVSRRQWIMP